MRRYLIIIAFLWAVMATAVFASPLENEGADAKARLTQSIEAAKQRLSIAKEREALAKIKLKMAEAEQQALALSLAKSRVTPKRLEHANLQYALTLADLDSIQLSLIETTQLIEGAHNRIARIQDRVKNTLVTSNNTAQKNNVLWLHLRTYQTILETEQRRLKTLTQAKDLIELRRDVHQSMQSTLNTQYDKQQAAQKREALKQAEKTLQAAQQNWLAVLARLNKQLYTLEQSERNEANIAALNRVNLKLIEAEEHSNLNQLKLVQINLNERLASTHSLKEAQSVAELKRGIIRLSSTISELENLQRYIKRKNKLLALHEKISQEKSGRGELSAISLAEYKNLLGALKKNYIQIQESVSALLNTSQLQLNNFQQALSKAMARRQNLPAFDINAWQTLGENLIRIPTFLWRNVLAVRDQAVKHLAQISVNQIILLGLTLGLWFGFWWEGKRMLLQLMHNLQVRRQTVKGDAVYIVLDLFRKHWGALNAVAATFVVLWLLSVNLSALTLFVYLALATFAFTFLLRLARLTLLETVVHISGHDVNLYRGIRWVGAFGYGLGVCAILAHTLPVDYSLSDFFNRLGMLYLFIVSLFLLYKRKVVPALLAPYLENARPYLHRLTRYLSVLIPLALLSNAVIGLIGYVGLAWRIAQYQMIFIVVLTSYILLRGMLIDIMRLCASFFIANIRNGWLWSEALLKPVDRLLRVGLFIFAWYVLFLAYGWDENSQAGQSVIQFLTYPLFTIGEAGISVVSFAVFIAVVALLYWGAKWSREFAYRLLLNHVRDKGVRNSLAVFTQYTVVIVGLYIALRAMAIDITALKFILGGLAVGIGFGLRDLANNFVSGILLLIERPVQTGDIVTMGEYEGEVVHIGMRSMTLHTWDHMEVLVPNSETFTKPFVNWTKQDSIIRTVIALKAHREDDPRRISAVIEKVLDEIPDVLADPKPEVLMREVNDALIDLEVRYFIDLEKVGSRIRARSKVLFKIWDAFKQNGMRWPYPQYDIHMTEAPKAKAQPALQTTL